MAGIFGNRSSSGTGAGMTRAGARPKNRGPLQNRGGGPGRNKGGGKMGGGLYPGRAGEAQTNKDPEAFFTSMLVNSGLMTHTGTPQDIWMRDEAVRNLNEQYQAWNATKQRGSPRDFMEKTYGASYGKKKGKTLNPGTLASVTEGLPEQYGHVYSNTNQEAFLNEEGSRQGLIGGAGGGATPNFESWYSGVFAPSVQNQFKTAQAAQPSLNMDDWMKTYDLQGRARRGFANRSDVLRPQSAAPQIGHWSWWA